MSKTYDNPAKTIISINVKSHQKDAMNSFKLKVFLLILLTTVVIFAQTSQMRIDGKPAKSPSEIVAVRDASGNFCSAIKVISDLDGFRYDAYNGVVRVDDNPGMDMVYLSTSERVLEVFHTGYEPLKIILSEQGISLKEKEVWEVRITGEAKLIDIPINIITQPEGATVFIDGNRMGTGQSYQIPVGNHTLRLVKDGYRAVSKAIEVSETSNLFQITLEEVEPLMVTITSNPTGAAIYIDDVDEGQTNKQLFKFPGEYNLKLIKTKYETIDQAINVAETGTNTWTFNLVKITAILTINTSPADAQVWINGELKTTKSLEVAPGRYRIEVKKDDWYSDSRTVTVEKGQDQSQTFTLKQMTGKLQLVVEPMETKVTMKQGSQQIDTWSGSKYKKDIPVGQYTLQFTVGGYADQKKTISIEENKTATLNIEMQRSTTVISTSRQQSIAQTETGTVTDIDGNVYQIVKIGDQWWMAENLKVTHYRNGDAVPNVTDNTQWSNLSTGAYCNYDNNSSNVATYGYLYNWYAVDDSRDIAPEGWHVPSDAEWQTLIDYLGGPSVAGGKMKEIGTTHWNSPNTGATNKSGFSALPGGYRYSNGSYGYMGYYAAFWSSTERSSSSAWYRYLSCYSSGVYRDGNYKQVGFSVRCVRD